MGTGQTELLIVPGKDPVWSPDGRYLAFVRDCSVLPVSELAGAERIMRLRPPEDEEVWFMNADGTEPRRLAAGGRPSWSSDSKHVYYQSPTESMLYLISIEDSDAEPKPILACSNRGLSVSPNDEYVAYVERNSLKIVDLASQLLVAEWSSPMYMWGCGAWSPTRDELFLAGDQLPEAGTGAWIYNLNRRQAAKVLDGKINSMSWNSDGTKLAFNVGPPYFEIWVADLDPNVSTVEALGPGRTLEEHYQEMVDHYTRTIEADPEDAESYFRRAQYYEYLNDGENVHADMAEYRAIRNPQEKTDGDNGQLETSGDQEAHTSFIFGTPTNLGLTVNDPACDWCPSISADGLELYFDSGRSGDHDIWVTTRATTKDHWGPPMNLGSPVNGPFWDQRPSISADSLMLFFCSLRSDSWDMWVTSRTTRDDPWSIPVSLGSTINSPSLDIAPCISANGLWLFFGSERPGGYGSADLWLTTRETIHDQWSTPVNLGPAVNSMVNEAAASISADGRVLFFSGATYGPFMPDGYGNADLWVTARATKNDQWSTPANLGPNVNSSYYELAPNISMDGSTLYFASDRDGGVGDFDLWQVSVTAISESFQKDSDANLVQKSAESNGKEVVPLTEDR